MANGPPTLGSGGNIELIGKVITQVGFPVVIAGVLLWFILTKFTATVQEIADRMSNNADAIQRLVEHEASTEKELQRQTVLLQQVVRRLESRTAPAPAPGPPS